MFVELNVLSGAIIGPLQAQGRAVALFELLSFYPLTIVATLLVTVNLVTFFVTSVDSGSLVASYFATVGRNTSDPGHRAIWPPVIGLVAIALLLGNGLNALQTAVIATGLPFGVVILLMVYTLYWGLRREITIRQSEAYQTALERESNTKSSDTAASVTHTGKKIELLTPLVVTRLRRQHLHSLHYRTQFCFQPRRHRRTQ